MVVGVVHVLLLFDELKDPLLGCQSRCPSTVVVLCVCCHELVALLAVHAVEYVVVAGELVAGELACWSGY